ncbi:hypothetical protein HDG35_005881 [Paraburkholderia sp. JPY681]|nr:hypothetical protein [Paraburkholderia atlantica]
MNQDTWIPIQDLLKQLLEQLERKPDDLKTSEGKSSWGRA